MKLKYDKVRYSHYKNVNKFPYIWIQCLDDYWLDEDDGRWKKIDEMNGNFGSSFYIYLKKRFRNTNKHLNYSHCQSPKAFVRLLKKWSKYLGHGIKFELVSDFIGMNIIGST